MMIKSFLGINNVSGTTRLEPGELMAATNVDIGDRGNLLSRRGRTLLYEGEASSVFAASFGIFALIGNDLVLLDFDGTLLRVVYSTIGYTRIWYTVLPDGRVAFSNGLVNGLATLTTTTPWGVPTPPDAGAGVAGGTLYQINYVRLSDGLEGPPTYGELIDETAAIIGLPVAAGYSINVYFAPYGEDMFLAGNTATDTFTPSGGPLGVQYVGSGSLSQPPAGTVLHAWNSRVLIADGSTLWATEPFQPELCNLGAAFLQMPDPITLLYGNSDGLFVGTTTSVAFLAGRTFNDLSMNSIAHEGAALGSAVEIDLSYLNGEVRPNNVRNGALCLVGGTVTLLYSAGQIKPLTAEKYRVAADEVHSTVRVRDGVLHYLAVPV